MRCPVLESEPFFAAAVDGKTCKQGLDENGNPEVLLFVFSQNLKLALAQFSVGETKSNESGSSLDELSGVGEGLCVADEYSDFCLAVDARSKENRKGNDAENPMEPQKLSQSPRGLK